MTAAPAPYRNLWLLFGILCCFTACENPKVTKEAPERNELKPNAEFTINLPEDHRDGSTWQLKDDFDAGVIESRNAVWHGNEKGIFFNLATKATGQATLTFVKRKYTDTLDTKQFIISIVK